MLAAGTSRQRRVEIREHRGERGARFVGRVLIGLHQRERHPRAGEQRRQLVRRHGRLENPRPVLLEPHAATLTRSSGSANTFRYARPVGYLVRLALAASCLLALVAAGAAEARAPAPRIAVLSNRADLVSGGDALVRVTLPSGVKASRLRLTAGRRDVTPALHRTGAHQLTGLVGGLRVGRVALTARIRSGSAARLFVTNHPFGGPVFAGPQIQPWTCQAGAKDKQCDQPPSFQFFYLPKGSSSQGATLPGTTSNGSGGPFQPYDPKSPPPADQIATTTTTEGVTVPFIVRLETGYLDRDQYAIAVLFDPSKRAAWCSPRASGGRRRRRRSSSTAGWSSRTASRATLPTSPPTRRACSS